jgi:hypothetical protein
MARDAKFASGRRKIIVAVAFVGSTAKALGLTIPLSLLLRADEVIQ